MVITRRCSWWTALLAGFVLCVSSSAWAVPASELVQRSRAAAAREDWNAAARSLEELVSAGIDSSDVLYDLGTIYAHAGRYGEAIWRLKQVLRRSPFAFDAQHNLRATRVRLAHRDAARSGRAVVETAVPFGTWLAELLPLDWAVSFALACQLGMLMGWLWFRRRRMGEIGRVAGVTAMVLLAAGWLVSASVTVARQVTPSAVIVLRDGVRLLRAPAADAIADVPVREGEQLELLDRQGVFARVRVPGGATGWLATRDLGALD